MGFPFCTLLFPYVIKGRDLKGFVILGLQCCDLPQTACRYASAAWHPYSQNKLSRTVQNTHSLFQCVKETRLISSVQTFGMLLFGFFKPVSPKLCNEWVILQPTDVQIFVSPVDSLEPFTHLGVLLRHNTYRMMLNSYVDEWTFPFLITWFMTPWTNL